jgi:hypothetical protein
MIAVAVAIVRASITEPGAATSINPYTARIETPTLSLLASCAGKLSNQLNLILGIGPTIVILSIIARTSEPSILPMAGKAEGDSRCN